MSVTMNSLYTYNDEMKKWIEIGDENEPLPEPVVIFDKYRVRLLSVNTLPILEAHSNMKSIGFPSDNFIVIDSKVPKLSRKENMDFDDEDVFDENAMDTTENKENNGPLHTSFLNLAKLKKRIGTETDDDFVSFDCVTPFDCTPISMNEAVSVESAILSSGLLNEEVLSNPIVFSTTSASLPMIAWKFARFISAENSVITGITRVLGFACDETKERIIQLNGAFPSGIYSEFNEFRSTYNIKRKVVSENRKYPGEVVVDMKWTTGNPKEFLSAPPSSTVCNVRVDLGWLDTRFFKNVNLHYEMEFVLKLADVLANPHKDVVFFGCGIPYEQLRAELDEVIKEGSRKNEVFGVTFGELEITEKLWKILYKCSDIEQAVNLLRTFFTALNFASISSQVHYDNRSRLAQLIVASKGGEFRIPRLEKLNTVEMIMEIGTEYLKRKFIADFSSQIQLSTDELEITIKNCEKEIRKSYEEAESRAIAILPISMALATVSTILEMIHEDSKSRVPEIARKVIAEHVTSLLSQLGQNKYEFIYEQTLDLSSLSPDVFANRRPSVWRCETRKTHGKTQVARMMTCLSLQMDLEHVHDLVKSSRPPITVVDDNGEKVMQKQDSDYTVSHTCFAYHQKN